MAEYDTIETFHGKSSTYTVQRAKRTFAKDMYYVIDKDSGKTIYTSSDRSDAVEKAKEMAKRH